MQYSYNEQPLSVSICVLRLGTSRHHSKCNTIKMQIRRRQCPYALCILQTSTSRHKNAIEFRHHSKYNTSIMQSHCGQCSSVFCTSATSTEVITSVPDDAFVVVVGASWGLTREISPITSDQNDVQMLRQSQQSQHSCHVQGLESENLLSTNFHIRLTIRDFRPRGLTNWIFRLFCL